MLNRLVGIVCFVAAAVTAVPLHAQRTPGVVSGSVRDSAGRPVENALIALDPSASGRTVRSDAQGRFRLDRVGTGWHELAIASIGYITEILRIEVPREGLELAIVLRQNVATIDTMRVVARRTGVHGTVIAREEFSALGDAHVQVIGAVGSDTTGADGRFELPRVRAGAYVVHVRRSGYQSRMLSITVPRDSSIELALLLDRAESDTEKRFALLLREFDQRRRWMTGPNAALIPRQELAGHEGQSLDDALRYSLSFLLKGLRIDDGTCIYVNGVFQPTRMARDYRAGDIEAVEVYGTGADYTGTVTATNSRPASRKPIGGICGWPADRQSLSTGISLDRRVMGRQPRPTNPARVEAIVIWLKR